MKYIYLFLALTVLVPKTVLADTAFLIEVSCEHAHIGALPVNACLGARGEIEFDTAGQRYTYSRNGAFFMSRMQNRGGNLKLEATHHFGIALWMGYDAPPGTLTLKVTNPHGEVLFYDTADGPGDSVGVKN